jgi:hypothetical protein
LSNQFHKCIGISLPLLKRHRRAADESFVNLSWPPNLMTLTVRKADGIDIEHNQTFDGIMP